MSIRYRIAFLFALIVSVILTIVSLSVYFFSVKERENAFKIRLKSSALYRARVFSDVSGSGFPVLRRLDTTAASSFYDKSTCIVDDDDVYAYSYSDSAKEKLVLSQDIIAHTKADNIYFFDFNNKKAVAIYHTDNLRNFIVAFSAVDLDGREYLSQLEKILSSSVLLAVILSFLAGLFFAQRLIQPIKRITGEVNLITSNNLSDRIKVDNNKDELSTLAETFNNLLNRLQASFTTQRRFISNASHELSTPLTSISSQLEVAMQKDRSQEDYKLLMQSVYEDVMELQLITRSLLDIAKTGPEDSIDLTTVRLDEILFKVISDVQKQNGAYKVVLNFEEFPEDENLLTVFGNSNLLYIAFKNIIENGCKYSDNNKSTVTAAFNKTHIIVHTSNFGDVINGADLENIFQPFFRTDSAQPKPGFGLGLTLAKRILSLHKGTINVESSEVAGTIFTIELPNILS